MVMVTANLFPPTASTSEPANHIRIAGQRNTTPSETRIRRVLRRCSRALNARHSRSLLEVVGANVTHPVELGIATDSGALLPPFHPGASLIGVLRAIAVSRSLFWLFVDLNAAV